MKSNRFLHFSAIVFFVVLLSADCRSQSFVAGPRQSVASQDELVAAGVRQYWPDSEFSVFPADATSKGPEIYTFTAAGGDSLGSVLTIQGSLARPVSDGISQGAAPIVDRATGIPIATTTYTYAGSGSIYRDTSGLWIQFYHAEHTFPGDTVGNFYSIIGIATSHDRGASWVNAGEIITPSVSYADWTKSVAASPTTFAELEIGAAPFTVVHPDDEENAYFYIYFHDGFGPFSYQNRSFLTSVARAKVRDVVMAAEKGGISRWEKFYRDQWQESGLGGLSTPLEKGDPLADGGFSVSYNRHARTYFMAVASGYTTPPGIFLTHSKDGIHWSPRKLAYLDPMTGPGGSHTVLYPTIVGQGEEPKVTGKRFHIYWSESQDSFSHVGISRVSVDLSGCSRADRD